MPNSDIASIIFKNWGGSECLFSLQVDKLACHGVIELARDMNLFIQRQKVYYARHSSIMNVMCPSGLLDPKSHRCHAEADAMCTTGLCHMRNSELKRPLSCQLLSNLPNFCPIGRHYPHFPDLKINLPSVLKEDTSSIILGCLLYQHP